MATIKFSKQASRVRVQLQLPTLDSLKDVQSLKEEVKFLKTVLQLKSSGGGLSEIIYKLKHLERENKELREQRSNKVQVSQVLRENHRLKSEMQLLLQGDSLRSVKRPDSIAEDSRQSLGSKRPADAPGLREKLQPASAGLLPSIHKPKQGKSLSSENSLDAKEQTEEASERLDFLPQIHASLGRPHKQPAEATASRIFVDSGERDFLRRMQLEHAAAPAKKFKSSHLFLDTRAPGSPFNRNTSLSSRHNELLLSHQRLLQQQSAASLKQRRHAKSQLDSQQAGSTPQRPAAQHSSSKRHHELVTIAAINTDKLEKLQNIHRLFESLEKRPGLGALASFKPVYKSKQRGVHSRFDSQLSSVKQEMARLSFN